MHLKLKFNTSSVHLLFSNENHHTLFKAAKPKYRTPEIMNKSESNGLGTASSSIPVDSLELVRNRLHQVHQSLRKLADQINYSNRNPRAKIPSYLNLHGQFQVLITQLHSLASHLEQNSDILRSTNAFPLPAFPTTQQEGLVTTLLRKKPLPEVDEWIDAAIAECSLFNLPLIKDDELAEWCYAKIKQLESDFVFEGFYTEKQRNYLETEEGKQETAKINSELAAKEEKELSIIGKLTPMTPNAILKFMTKGI